MSALNPKTKAHQCRAAIFILLQNRTFLLFLYGTLSFGSNKFRTQTIDTMQPLSYTYFMTLLKIIIYKTQTGKVPFNDWRNKLDNKIKFIIANRLDRIALGNFGDSKSIQNGEGVKELRIDYGPGYRIYFGVQNEIVVILLIGGEKKSQGRDIEKAKQYWLECKEKLL